MNCFLIILFILIPIFYGSIHNSRTIQNINDEFDFYLKALGANKDDFKVMFNKLEHSYSVFLQKNVNEEQKNSIILKYTSYEIESLDSKAKLYKNIRILIVTETSITKINKDIFPNTIEWLILSKNYIDYIEKDSFSYLENLVHLDLSFNRLVKLDLKFFEPLRLNLNIKLSHNEELKNSHFYIKSNFSKELKVDFTYTNLQDVPNYKSLTNDKIFYFFMFGNNLKGFYNLSFDFFTKKISCHNGPISIDNFFPILSRLEIQILEIQNSLEEHPNFAELDSLTDLVLRLNVISSIKCTRCYPARIKNINLESNLIEYVEWKAFENLKKLQSLVLNNNRIKEIDTILIKSSDFNNLELKNNRIIRFKKLWFASEKNLVYLNIDLSRNRLNAKPLIIGNITSIKHLSLKNQLNSNFNILDLYFDFSFTLIRHYDLSNNNLKYIKDDLFCHLRSKNFSILNIDISNNFLDLNKIECLKAIQLGDAYKINIISQNESYDPKSNGPNITCEIPYSYFCNSSVSYIDFELKKIDALITQTQKIFRTALILSLFIFISFFYIIL